MKKLLLLVMAVTFVGLSTGCIYSTEGEKLSLVEDLPDTEKWQTETGTYKDAYVIYNQSTLFWIFPMFNNNARYVLSSGGSVYYEFQDPSDKNDIESKHGSPSSLIPFWDRFGGKIIFGIPISFFIIGCLMRCFMPSGVGGSLYVRHDGEDLGPLSIKEAKAMLSKGELLADDKAWMGADGMRPLNLVLKKYPR